MKTNKYTTINLRRDLRRPLFALFLSIACLSLLVSCDKNKGKEESRYYVKYSGTIVSKFLYSASYTVVTESGTKTDTGIYSDYSVTIGPVKKGFKASITCDCDKSQYSFISQSVTIEVSKDGDPFVLKASGTNQASYVIDY